MIAIVLATSAQTFNGAPMPGLPSDTHSKGGLPLGITYTVDICNSDLCVLECLANQLQRPCPMMLCRIPRKKSLSRRCDMRMPDICQDDRRPAFFGVLYYPDPDLVCASFYP